MSDPISKAIRASLIGIPGIADPLARYKDAPGIFTRRPVPAAAEYPMIVTPSFNAGATNEDGLRSRRPVLVRDVIVYGLQPGDYRVVDTVAGLISQHFHRNRFALSIEGYQVVDIVADMPRAAPTDNDKQVGRLVQLQLRLKTLPVVP